MPPKIEKYQMRLRMESKAEENRAKPPLQSPDVAETAEFLFSRSLPHRGGRTAAPSCWRNGSKTGQSSTW